MPRDSNGVYTLPEAAFVPNTIIQSLMANSDFNDIALALTESLATTGVTTMAGPFRIVDGTISAPSLTFSQAAGIGFYRSGTNQFRWVVNGSVLATFNASATIAWQGDHSWNAGGNITGTLTSDTFFILTSVPNSSTYQGRIITAIDTGHRMVFANAGAPTGWFVVGVNDFAIRVMASGGSSGGAVAFSTVFGQQASSFTTPDNVAHVHDVVFVAPATANLTPNFIVGNVSANGFALYTTQSQGTSALHAHNYDVRTLFLDAVIAQKS